MSVVSLQNVVGKQQRRGTDPDEKRAPQREVRACSQINMSSGN